MSTKIYNGIKFKSKDFNEVLKQLQDIKPKALELLEIDDSSLEYVIMRNSLLDKDVFNIWDLIKNDLQFANEWMFKVVLFPTDEGDIYGYYMNVIAAYASLLNDISEEFVYYNNTDHPEEIDYVDWERRGTKWDLILPLPYIVDNGFSYDIISVRDLEPHVYRKRIKEVVEVMKRDHKINSVLNGED